jgi:DNA-binding MarR family transcriptional regulator
MNAFLDTRACSCSRIRKASRAVTQHFEDHFRGSGLRATQFTVLSTLLQTGPISISKLAEMLGLERTTLTRNLSPLIRQKYVSDSNAEDGRIRMLAITKRGERMAKDTLERWRQAQATVGAVLAEFRVSLK